MDDYFEVSAYHHSTVEQLKVLNEIEVNPCTVQDFEKYFPDQLQSLQIYDISYFLCIEDLSDLEF